MDYSRPLIPIICIYTLGVWLVHELYHSHPVACFVTGALVLAIAAMLAVRQRELTPVYLAAFMALGASMMIGYEVRAGRAAEVLEAVKGPELKFISGRVDALAEVADTEYARIVLSDVRVTSGAVEFDFPGRMQVNYRRGLNRDSDTFVAGERIRFAGQVSRPSALQNFFGYNRLESVRHEEIYGVAKPVAIPGSVQRIEENMEWQGRGTLALVKLRRLVSAQLEKVMQPREGRLMAAMLFNDMRKLTDEEKDIFRLSGTYHLFAVSGMHVAILGLILHIVFRALRLGVRSSWLAVAVCLFLYLWLIGFVPSATRSYLMLVAFTLGYMIGREVDSLTSLVFAIAVALLYDPLIWWNAGFTLSVAGVAAIVIFVPRLKLWFGVGNRRDYSGLLGGGKYWLMEAAIVTLAISLFMLPLQLYYFGYWNVLSPLANMFQAFLSTAVLGAGVLCVAIGWVSSLAWEWVGSGASAIMRVIYEISRLAAEAGWAVFYVSRVPLEIMLACYGIALTGYYMTSKDTPEFALKSRARFITHTACGLGLLFGYILLQQVRPHGLEIYGFDVGQGDATLVRFPDNRTMLVDGGIDEPDMGRLVVLPQLRGLGVTHLDVVVATHDDGDHTGGLASILKEIPVRKLLVPLNFEPGSGSSRDMMKAASDRYVDVRPVGQGMEFALGNCRVEFLNPAEAAAGSSDNNRSVVTRISYGDFTALLTGDAGLEVESRLLSEGKLSPVTLLKAGHHGSKTSSGRAFVEAVRPQFGLISCGAGNHFGHPNPAVLDNIKAVGTAIYRTDTMGAFRLETNGNNVEIRTAGF